MTETTQTKSRWKFAGIVVICTAVLIAGGYLVPGVWTTVISALAGLL